MHTHDARFAAGIGSRPPAGKYLTFDIADVEYGLEILGVSEIIGMRPMTRVPRMPAFVRGVINLRGTVVPIIDLRTRFAMDTGTDPERCLVIAQLHRALTGLVVDRVNGVVALTIDDIEALSPLNVDIHAAFLSGLSRVGGRVRYLLNLEQVLAIPGTLVSAPRVQVS